jgi:hypothetical protein
MVHTPHFANGTQAHNDFDAIKSALGHIIEQPAQDGTATDTAAGLAEFNRRYP